MRPDFGRICLNDGEMETSKSCLLLLLASLSIGIAWTVAEVASRLGVT